MKSIILSLLVLFGFVASSQEFTSVKSDFSAKETHSRLVKNIEEKGLRIFQVVDHSKAAEDAELSLKPVKVVMFGNPKMGTPLMQADPRVGLELPMKMLIYETEKGVFVGYKDPLQLSETYNLEKHQDLLQKMSKAMADLAQKSAKKA
jgi:uncharacterized protein (DUF302 family)